MAKDHIRELTRLSAQDAASLSAAQSRVLRALADHAPGGRLRFTVDLAAGTVEVEPDGEGAPCSQSS